MDAKRLAQLADDGVITITGNLKFDVIPNDTQLAHGKAFKQQQNRSIIALASTREGEEAMLLSQLQPWLRQQINKPLILLIPRHPKRAAELTALLQSNSWQFCQRSMGETPTAQTELYLCDTLGEMWFYYGASDIAVVGGGWLPHGGQNLIEPCMAACAVVVGPHMFNFAHATQLAVQQNAVIQCSDVMQLSTALDDLNHVAARANYAAAGLAFAAQHTGAAKAHLALMGHHGPLISR
jgi:3-deoxy-D-manno-octulosonic-acid transferase